MKSNTKITALIIVGVLCLVAVAGFGSSLLATTPLGGGGGSSSTHAHTPGESVISQHNDQNHSAIIKCETCEQVITAVYVDHVWGEQGDCLQCGYYCDCVTKGLASTADVAKFDGQTLIYSCALCGSEKGSTMQPNAHFSVDASGYPLYDLLDQYEFGRGMAWRDFTNPAYSEWLYNVNDNFVDTYYQGRYAVGLRFDERGVFVLFHNGVYVDPDETIIPDATYTLVYVES